MNDIEYRAWDKNCEYMNYFTFKQLASSVISNMVTGCFAAPVEDNVFMPYIGLKDKNDTKIFEYDIVRFEDKLWIVYYKTNVASFVLSNGISCINFNVFDTNEMKVIGDKFHNPKLYAKIRKGKK